MAAVTATAKPRYRVQAGSRITAKASGETLMLPRAPRSAHQAGDPFDRSFAGNFASQGSADRDWLRDRLTAVPRARDLIANEPLAASAVEQKLSLLIGDGWRFEAAPEPAAFGLDPASPEYEALANSFERAWRRWSTDPLFRNDYEERLPFDLQLDLLTRQVIGAEGEAVAMLPFVERDGWYGTTLQVFDPDRLAQPAGTPETDMLRAGIRFDDRGRPLEYHILDGHPYDVGFSATNRFQGRWVPRMTPGMPTETRPFFLHAMRTKRAGQSRGISDFMSALHRFQMFRDLTEAELRTRLINAMVVAQYTSGTSDPEALAEIMGSTAQASQLTELRSTYYEEAGISTVAGSRVIQPFPGDELKWNSEVRAANAYADVAHFVAIQCGAPIGLSYELMTRDFSKTTFSSARTAINDAFRMVKRERGLIRNFIARPVMLCVLQEAYEEGELALPAGAPSIWDDPGAYLKGEWIGPGREYIDPVKEATGDRLEIENLSASPGDIAARRGQSLDDLIARFTREKAKISAAGLTLGDLSNFIQADSRLSASDNDA